MARIFCLLFLFFFNLNANSSDDVNSFLKSPLCKTSQSVFEWLPPHTMATAGQEFLSESERGCTQLYPGCVMAYKSVLIHPYHPTEKTLSGNIPYLCNALNLTLPPQACMKNIPLSFQNFLHKNEMKEEEITIQVVTQNYDWKDKPLLRPQYWTDPKAPSWGNYSTECNMTLLIESTDGVSRTFDGKQESTCKFSVHPGSKIPSGMPGAGSLQTILSGCSPRIQGLDAGRDENVFYTLCKLPNCAVMTLHGVLNDKSQNEIENFLNNNEKIVVEDIIEFYKKQKPLTKNFGDALIKLLGLES